MTQYSGVVAADPASDIDVDEETTWTCHSRLARRMVIRSSRWAERSTSTRHPGEYHLVIDMEKVEFLDSTGLGVLVGGLKKVRAHDGSMRLICNQERLLKIFRITGLAKVFAIHGSQADALAER
jgi:anti-sigma B factor antagonist